MVDSPVQDKQAKYVGTLVGESTSREFRLAVAEEAIREQDIIAVDAELNAGGATIPSANGSQPQKIRIWAKVQTIERLNPLFPRESGHELAASRTDPFDTVLSLSREMVTAVCKILGSEPINGNAEAGLTQVRYPPRPATSAYRPESDDIARIVLGALDQNRGRALDVATLANREDVDVKVDGHVIVARHLAILAMTGAGKSWAARRTIEELAQKNYPIVIFDPGGDYAHLRDVLGQQRVKNYYPQFPLFDESPEDVLALIESLSWDLSNQQRDNFSEIFRSAKAFYKNSLDQDAPYISWLSDYLSKPNIQEYGIQPNLYFLADFTEALVKACKSDDEDALDQLENFVGTRPSMTKQVAGWVEGSIGRFRRSAREIRVMEQISRERSNNAVPLPTERSSLVNYGQVSVVSLSGYSGHVKAAIYSLIVNDLFEQRVSERLKLPVLFLIEEAHEFAPANPSTPAERRGVNSTRLIAQEGRKFLMGLIVISQRPSRLDETTLAMCNSQIIMRMVNPADQSFVRRVVESLGEDEVKMLPDLDLGEALLSGQFVRFPILVKMKPPASRGAHEEEDAFVALEKAHKSMGADRTKA